MRERVLFVELAPYLNALFHRTAAAVLAAVQQAMSAHSTTAVTTTGHSLGQFHSSSPERTSLILNCLGAAISLLDALYLTIQLPSASVNFIGYGLPRVSVRIVLVLLIKAHDHSHGHRSETKRSQISLTPSYQTYLI